MRKQYKIFNHTLEFDKTELICIYAFTGFAILDGIALGLIGLIELLVRQQMTNEEKALETLIWINDYIKGLKNSEWNNQSVTWVILNRVETVLKGMSDEDNQY